jgi:hypothetical protein
MSKQRQKGIGITVEERAHLDKMKALYEKATGEHCDWGKFLIAASLLALEALKNGYKIVTIVRVQHDRI